MVPNGHPSEWGHRWEEVAHGHPCASSSVGTHRFMPVCSKLNTSSGNRTLMCLRPCLTTEKSLPWPTSVLGLVSLSADTSRASQCHEMSPDCPHGGTVLPPPLPRRESYKPGSSTRHTQLMTSEHCYSAAWWGLQFAITLFINYMQFKVINYKPFVNIKLFYCPKGRAGLDAKSWRFILASDEPTTLS